jgi:hypothetical protein
VKRALEADRKKQEDMPVGRPAPPLQVRRIDPDENNRLPARADD